MGYKTPPEYAKFKKGQSGNLKGRPKMPDLKDVIESEVGEAGIKKIVAKLRLMAQKGNVKASEILLDRAYGKAKESIEVSDVTPIKSYKIVPASQRTRDSGE